MSTVPFPTLRLRDTVRVTSDVTMHCRSCGHVEALDVIALACRNSPHESVQNAVKSLTCARCGAKGAGEYEAFGAPSTMRYELRLGDVMEPVGTVIARCTACHRCRPLDVFALCRARSVSPDTRLKELESRLRCEGCGQRGWTEIRLNC